MNELDTLVAFVGCTDSAKARAFYVDLLDLDLVSEDAFALVLRTGATIVRVQKLDKIVPQPFTVLGWQVHDIRIVAARLQRKGAVFERYKGMDQDQTGVWQSPSGARIVWFKDPDGNLLSLTEISS